MYCGENKTGAKIQNYVYNYLQLERKNLPHWGYLKLDFSSSPVPKEIITSSASDIKIIHCPKFRRTLLAFRGIPCNGNT